MKTKNNIQKRILISLTIAVCVILISVTVSAQYFWNETAENYIFTTSEIGAVEKSTINSPANGSSENTFASILEIENEEPLALEDWMMDELNFSTLMLIEEEVETPLNLEDWMTSEKIFYTSSLNLEVETEAALKLESWMINSNNFGVLSFQLIEVNEAKLELQDWMLNKNLFEEKIETEQSLQLEEWMVSEKVWMI